MSESQQHSYRQILRSSSIIGGASIINILIGMMRVKVLAVLLGPTGMGLMGLLNAVMSTTSTLAGMGLGTSGVRQLAASKGDSQTLARVRRALWTANLGLGALGGAALWWLREPIARWVFDDDVSRSGQIGWLGIGVLLSLIAGSQTALLQGMRRIGDLAQVSVLGGLLGTIGGILAIWQYGEAGVLPYVLLGPAMNVVVASIYAVRLPRPAVATADLGQLLSQWRLLLALGVVFMVTALMPSAVQLVVRALITRDLGLEATGQFQAAWAISMQYIDFVLGAMGADYYPRLTEAIGDRSRANRLVDEQAEVGLLLAGPVILAMLALAPWIIQLLYSEKFANAVIILRWQIMGDILKVVSWPMGFILIARAERTLFFCTQSFWFGSYLLLIWVGLPRLGLEITGIAFFICYWLGFIINCLITYRINGFYYRRYNLLLLTMLLASGAFICLLAWWHEGLAAGVGLLLALGMGLYTLRKLVCITALGGRLGHLLRRFI
ncbi:MAG: O-antigen translocase [Candidatus Competibacteraceae bacterium]